MLSAIIILMFTAVNYRPSLQAQQLEITLYEQFDDVVNVYQPTTGIVAPATVIERFQTIDDLESILQREERPATMIFQLSNELMILDGTQNAVLTLQEALSLIYPKIIPAFEVTHMAQATLLGEALAQYQVLESFVVASETELIVEVRNRHAYSRGILAYRHDDDLTIEEQLSKVRQMTNQATAVAVLLPIQYATTKTVSHLQQRVMTVWIDAGLRHVDQYLAIASGAQGIVVNQNYQNVFEIYASYPEITLVRRPFVIAHRGLRKLAPENTIEAGMEAYLAGVDIIELDIRMTLDYEIVVIHDNTTQNVSDEIVSVSNSILSRLQNVILRNADGTFTDIRVPTLRSYFEAFKGLDVVLFVEPKGLNVDMINRMIALIEEYDMYDQVSIIGFERGNLEHLKENYPQMSGGYLLGGSVFSENLETAIADAIEAVVPYGLTINPNSGSVRAPIVNALVHRGITIWPWTILPSALDYHVIYGSSGLTTDAGDYYQDSFLKMVAPKTEYTYTLGAESISIELNLATLLGELSESQVELTRIDDAQTDLEIDGNHQIQSANQTGQTYYVSTAWTTLPGGQEVLLVGDVILINIITSDQDSSNLFLYITGGIVLGGLLIFGTSLFLKKIKKEKGED